MNEKLTLTPEQQRIFDSAPDLRSRPCSRLDPHCALILRWRGQGRSYREIRQLLADQCELQISYVALYMFVQRRSRPRTSAETEPQAVVSTPATIGPVKAPAVQAAEPARPKRTPEEIAAMRESARAVNHRPVVQKKEDDRPLFHYDPTKRLINKNYLDSGELSKWQHKD